MLSEYRIETLPERIYERLNAINSECLVKIGEIIKKIGELRPKDIHQLQQMYNYGADIESIILKLSKASEKNIDEIYEIFDIVAKENYDYSKPFYMAKDIPHVPYEENADLQRYVKNMAKQTVKEYKNLTQHTAFAVFSKDGKSIAPLFERNKNKKATSISDTYTKVIDIAVQKVQMGVSDYNSEMRSVVRALADSGIKTVDYATGYKRRLDTSVRQNVLWGVKECNQNSADIIGEEIGADGYEISYHSNPRPSHEEMGGKQYAKGKGVTINGKYYPPFSSVEHLLKDYGCLHFKFSIVLGISRPAYDEKELSRLKAEDRKTFEFEGKKYTKYEATQIQRNLETQMRKQRDLHSMAKASGDKELQNEAKERINFLTSKYSRFSKASGLPTKMERTRIAVSRNKALTKNGKGSIIKVDKVVTGHDATPKQSKPNSVIDHKTGTVVDTRTFYDVNGLKHKEIQTGNHGNPKHHPYGKRGEHVHEYEWDENQRLKNKTTRELTETERRENEDIL